MITVRRLTQGKAWEYLTDSVAKTASDPDQESALTRYYTATGCPPGRFRGAGLAALGLADGDVVTDEHLQRMLGDLADPVTGEPVGSAPKRAKQGQPVAGFDLTFSPWKSISVAWAMADQGTQALIFECHERAIKDTLAYAEEHYIRSRRGKGGVAFEEVEGAIAASFTHYDSRSHDPDLHDHVVVWNRARGASDGKWRTLDSKGLYQANQALSVLHANILATYLTEALGWGWDQTETRKGMVKAEVTGVPERLMAEFSQRTKDIEALREKLLTQFRETYGRDPNPVEFDSLNQQANQRTRASKEHCSLEELAAAWRERAGPYIGPEPASWVSTLAWRNDLPALRSGDISDEMLADVARVALRRTSERRSTHSRAQIETQVGIELFGVRFASKDDLISVTRRATDMALDGSVQVSVGDLHHVPQQWKSRDKASKFRPVKERLYTTNALLEAEARLFGLAERHDAGLSAGRGTVAQVCDQPLPGREHKPGLDQALAVEQVATSGRVLDIIVGPAGTGKTTALAALRAVWEAERGAGSVVGLAPSAAAAQVLADELGITTENTAKWLYESDRDLERRTELAELRARLTTSPSTHPGPLPARAEHLASEIEQWSFKAGQLVIVDEASLAGTFVLDRLAARAAEAGAKVVLVGDPGQLSSVEAGGMFRALARRGDGMAELTDVRRFAEAWEAKASIQVRAGREEAIDTYLANGRVVEGDRDSLLDKVYQAWKTDTKAGEVSLMIAGDSATVNELNARARADRVAAGEVKEKGLALSGGGVAGVGDVVVTRENARLLSTGRGWVKNGDRWVVTATHRDGSMAVQRSEGGGSVVLPADYAAEHVELGYATTAHRAQGRTVGTTHAIISPTTTREVAYVAITRGRNSNRLYVDTHWDPGPDTSHEGMTEPRTAKEVLASVLARTGADVSATDTIRTEQETAESTNRVWAEYATIAARPQGEHWDALLAQCLAPADFAAVKTSDAIGPLHMALAQAAAHGIDIEAELPGLSRNLAGLRDVAAGLEARITRHTRAAVEAGKATSAGLIAGLLPRAVGIESPDIGRALAERDHAIEARAEAKLAEALARHERWTAGLGDPPVSPAACLQWERGARTVAAYRDRWDGPANRPLPQSEQCRTKEQLAEWARAKRALDACRRLSAAEQEVHELLSRTPGVDMGMGL